MPIASFKSGTARLSNHGVQNTIASASGEFSHGGSNNGYRARIMASKSIGKGVIVLTNGNNGSKVHEPIEWLIDAAFGPQLGSQTP